MSLRPIKNEIGIWFPCSVVAPIAKQPISQSFLRGCLQKACGDDLVGVDIVDRERCDPAGKRFELIHERSYNNVRTSVTTPVTALAAAVKGLARKVLPPFPCRPSRFRLLVETLYSPAAS